MSARKDKPVAADDADVPRPVRWVSGNGRFQILVTGPRFLAVDTRDAMPMSSRSPDFATLPEAMAWCAARAAR